MSVPAIFANLATGNPVIVKAHPNGILPMAIIVQTCRLLSSSITIPAGTTTADIYIEPTVSSALETREEVILSLLSAQDYELSSQQTATISIVEYGPSNGNIFYVDTNGDDNNIGDEAHPFQRFQLDRTQLVLRHEHGNYGLGHFG